MTMLLALRQSFRADERCDRLAQSQEKSEKYGKIHAAEVGLSCQLLIRSGWPVNKTSEEAFMAIDLVYWYAKTVYLEGLSKLIAITLPVHHTHQ